MNLKRTTSLAALILAGTSCALAWAATPAETITARQNNFKAMGRAFKGINDELKKPAPDLALIRANAQIVDQAAGHVAHGFPRGTGAETGIKTSALPAIWARAPEFRTAASRLTTATRAFKLVTRGNDLAAIRAAVPSVGGSCKGCHDTFKGHD
jgi:cytochrome c556